MQVDMNPRGSHVKKVAHCLSHNIRKLTLDVLHHKTYLYTDPIKPHFYAVKLGVTGYTLFFLFLLKKHRLWVLVRTASAKRFERIPTIYVLNRSAKNLKMFI